MRILEVLPRVVDPEPTVLNSALIEHPSATLPPLDLTIPRKKSLFDQLLEGQENRRIGNRCEFDYVAVTAQSPLHRTPSQRTPAWIVTHMGIEGEGKVSDWARLEPGMGVRLFDEGLGKKNYGFEKVWLFGIIGRPYSQEPGYYVFWLEPHLFTITQHPIPVRIRAALIAIPNCLLPEWHYFNQIHECTLGQRLVAGSPGLLPPLRPWESNWAWKHPEAMKIDQWHVGLKPTLEEDWSHHHEKD